MIYCRPGSASEKVSVPVPDPNNISSVFQQNKICSKSCIFFQCQKQHYFPESWPLTFDFCFIFHFMLDPDPNPVPELRWNF
jgi:hypothetical protein